ncbi:hypothetical protein ANACOL_00101 [Anaerotruncus colihominis DSM 17241]|uniref:Uncharacterized protein n=1 Tax=Anaerotruncus colihominis DSM 17241 TaxID=445972 RepID=B0P5S9_9FIRM|nr:hypothetical protein ANACOL_00101 [Anaerotruncus colihominis DSM 17241]
MNQVHPSSELFLLLNMTDMLSHVILTINQFLSLLFQRYHFL